MMRDREKVKPQLYPKWSKQDSPARRAKERDGDQCVICHVKNRTLITDEAGKPRYILYLHAAHLHYLDPDPVEAIEGQRLRAMCPRHHRQYDLRWQRRAAECEHQATLHRILLTGWFAQRFTQVL